MSTTARVPLVGWCERCSLQLSSRVVEQCSRCDALLCAACYGDPLAACCTQCATPAPRRNHVSVEMREPITLVCGLCREQRNVTGRLLDELTAAFVAFEERHQHG